MKIYYLPSPTVRRCLHAYVADAPCPLAPEERALLVAVVHSLTTCGQPPRRVGEFLLDRTGSEPLDGRQFAQYRKDPIITLLKSGI